MNINFTNNNFVNNNKLNLYNNTINTFKYYVLAYNEYEAKVIAIRKFKKHYPTANIVSIITYKMSELPNGLKHYYVKILYQNNKN